MHTAVFVLFCCARLGLISRQMFTVQPALNFSVQLTVKYTCHRAVGGLQLQVG